jgi:hypothetical protein
VSNHWLILGVILTIAGRLIVPGWDAVNDILVWNLAIGFNILKYLEADFNMHVNVAEKYKILSKEQ